MTVQDNSFPLVTLYYVWVSFVYGLSLNYEFSIQIENGVENAIGQFSKSVTTCKR